MIEDHSNIIKKFEIEKNILSETVKLLKIS